MAAEMREQVGDESKRKRKQEVEDFHKNGENAGHDDEFYQLILPNCFVLLDNLTHAAL